jgi:DNA-binding CsgD family transcriptional regulator
VTLRDKVWTRLIDPSTWTGIFYEVAQFPIGIAAFVAVVVGFSVAGAFIAAPVILWADGSAFELDDGQWVLGIDRPIEGLALLPLGLLTWFLTMHVITCLSALHAMWARLMLGTRSRLRPGASRPQTSEPPPDDGVKLLPPVKPFPSIDGPDAAVTEPPPREPSPPLLGGDGEAHPALAELTPREREVLLLAVRGYSNADICEALYVSEGTVKTHIRHILSKLDLLDRTQLIVFAYEQGVIRPEGRAVSYALAR